MKNKLIVITSTIGRMGGAQMYVENKVKYFQSKGWDVFVFYYLWAENILLPGMVQFKDNYIPDLRYPIQFVPKYCKKKILAQIRDVVQPGEGRIVIETQLVLAAYWGELIAKDLKARHVINIIEEQFPDFDEKENAFFEFKLLAGDNMNATPKRLRKMFKDRFKEEYEKQIRKVAIPCANVVSSEVKDNYQFEDCDYTILSIGRLDKPYIPKMNEEIKKFAVSAGGKKLNVVYVGGSYDGSMEVTIPRFFKEVDNVRCYILGYVFPISRELIKKADVAIACANSVLVSASEGVPTIVVDVNDYSAIGVYGYTTKNLFKREDEKQETVSGLLQQILLDKAFENAGNVIVDIPDQNEVFERELSYFIERQKVEYFDVNSIYSIPIQLLSKTKYLIRKIINK